MKILIYIFGVLSACPCDHGECKYGVCLCENGWDGVNCEIPTCKNECVHGKTCVRNAEKRFNAEISFFMKNGLKITLELQLALRVLTHICISVF